MAQQEVQLDRERFCCPICLDLLKDPVTTGCGHSFCKSCINTHWDKGEERGSYSCPQCRQFFTPRPVLEKNTMLADLVEELKKTGLQAAPADHCYAGPEDVACDVCTGRKLKALKSCLNCLVSYCEKHLQPHLQLAPFKRHKLVEPSEKLQENICSRHDEVMKMFCRTDQQCICYLCSVEEHKDHDTVSAAAERTERQRELGLRRQTIQQRVQDTEKDVKLLQQEEEALNGSADKAVEDSEEIFTEMIRLLQKRSSDVKQQIRSQQETEVSRVRELQERLEQEITELKRRDQELKQLSDTEDHNQFLHNYPSLSPLSGSTHSSSIRIRPLRHFEDVTAAVSQVRGRLQDILSETETQILQIVSQVDVLLPQPDPETRADFLRYSQEITLDPNTVNKYLLLSEGNRKVTCMRKEQSYSDHPDRFTDWPQVLSRESLTGRCYWEVEVGGGGVGVAVTYKNIRRAGNSDECIFGFNDKSWSLYCSGNSYNFHYNSIMTLVSCPVSSRVGVYLDHRAGVLSFYSVSDTMTLLHRVQTTFTQPLYAGVSVEYTGSTAEFCKGRSRDLFLFTGSETVLQSLAAAEMAQQEVHLDRERFSCPICLDLLKDPVTTGCGHSYCKSCINTHWDQGEERGSYSCPQCRQTFTPRPVLEKSTMLADSLEELKKTGLQAAPADHCYAGPEDVACDVCTGRKLKALKSCLVCLVSYCEKHLQPHLQLAPFKRHKLVEPSEKLQENICSRHDEVMKMFCRTDQQCICYLCSVEEHKDHDTVSAAAERTERQRELGLRRQTIQQRVQDTEKDLKLLQQEEEALNGSADKAVEDSEEIFTEMIRLLEKRSSDVKQQIRSQQETEVSRVRELQERLEQEITELKRKDHELKQLSDTEDHNQFLHNYPSLSPLSGSTHSSSFRIRPLRNFEDVTAAVSQVRGRLQDILSETETEILQIVSQVDVLLPQPEPETRADFLRYSQEITLDPNTANKRLLLSEGNRKVTWTSKDQSYSDHPDRFTDCHQVLSRESLTGRCYWEVEWRWGGVSVAVTYKNISRAVGSDECIFGFNDKSWSLHCYENSYNFHYNSIMTPVSGPVSSRVGVYLDHSAGVLSFYRVSDTMTLLHRVQTTFTQPLYAGVGVYCSGSTAEFCKLK
ncbi:LOW QUALITY PROTEIN: E3 ubiquitin/ISG15 ligase TRIM25-like [Pleuronectes platessa]|uniref:LOW QUALITY PROTEIN: E3 ubiquitin/ISG15 ligase TRIM25-like n=1 Tax=Pleuronectes platessa TaxID=8262 RepID=UPI00232A3D30|nr:LOW QUALITY PROTEIN: E3 ubiquitin/ISG15 ligase TRIM25-like [Pleuronectes platessa]